MRRHKLDFLDAATRCVFCKRLRKKYQLIFEILLNTGLKPSELVSLRPDDLFLDERYLLVPTVSVRKPRSIPLNPSTVASFYLWKQHYLGQSYLFDLHPKSISERFRRVSLPLAILITPQRCRHTYISSIYWATRHIGIMQQAAGHQNPRSTLLYCHPIGDDVKVESVALYQ